MKIEIEWLADAIATKDISSPLTYYRVADKEMLATNQRMIAGYPYDAPGKFMVPGEELTAILRRLPNEPTIRVDGGKLILRSGRFSGSLDLLPDDDAVSLLFQTIDKRAIEWKKFPQELPAILKDLRPFVSDNNIHTWSLGIAIDHGWCYSTNNVVLAGAPFPPSKDMQALIPAWVVDFLLDRVEGLTHWAVTDLAMFFKWSNGAWMRSNLIEGQFPERAGEMIRSAPSGSQAINEDYRRAVARIAELSDETVAIYADRVEGKTARSKVTEAITSAIPSIANHSIWGAKYIAPMIEIASNWEPSLWPKPVPFTGERVRGFIAGRTA